MKNEKNAFTLIELLAIIVILAIIAVITVPIILNIIENSRKGAVIDSAYGYRDSIQQYYVSKSVVDAAQQAPSGVLKISELPADFSVNGITPTDGWVKIDKGQVVSFSLKFGDYVVNLNKSLGEVSAEKNGILKNKPLNIEFVSGNKDTVGSNVTIGNEKFTVLIKDTNGELALLAKSCLKSDLGTFRQVTESEGVSVCTTSSFSGNTYWHESNHIKDDYAKDIYGNSASYDGNPKPYIYDSNEGNINFKINQYVQTLSSNATGRLMTYEEANNLDESIRNIYNKYWLGSARSYYRIWIVNNNGYITDDSHSSGNAIRPVVIISTSDL